MSLLLLLSVAIGAVPDPAAPASDVGSAPTPQEAAPLSHGTAGRLRTGDDLLPDTHEQAAPHLLPRLRSVAWYGSARLSLLVDGSDALPPRFEPIGGGLAVDVAYDTPTRIVTVEDARLLTWQVSPDRVMARALQNLQALPHCGWREVQPGLFASSCGDSYDAGRMLDDAMMARLTVRGDRVALPNSPDLLLVTGTAEPQALAELAGFLRDVSAPPRWITSAPLVKHGDSWELRGDGFDTLDRLTVATWYHDQAALLSEAMARGLMPEQFTGAYSGTDQTVRQPGRCVLLAGASREVEPVSVEPPFTP